MKKIRWWIAKLIDRWCQRVCWAELVVWSLGYPLTIRDCFERYSDCKSDCDKLGCCYCGKVRDEDR